MSDNGTTIRAVEKRDLPELAELLTDAFYPSPFYRYIAPDDAERRSFLYASFQQRLDVGFGVNHMDVAVEGTRIKGLAVWNPPQPEDSPPQDPQHPAINPELAALLNRQSPGLRERFTAFFNDMIATHVKLETEPLWGLAPIAVRPEEQGKGVGSILMRKKFAEIDAGGLPCILSTQDAVNVAIYERFGFKTVAVDPIRPPDLATYTLVRPGAQSPEPPVGLTIAAAIV